MKKILISFITVFLITILLSACNNDNANNDNGNNNNNQTNNDGNISSLSTDQSSNDYPETQPIKTQDAKYEFRKAPEGQQATPENKAPNTNNVANKQNTQQAKNGNYALSNFESDVVTLTNKERQQAGLSLLEVDNALSNVAREKSNDMQRNGYFSHTSPTYGSPFDMMRDFGITYQSAGENIAQGQRTPDEVVQAWMNSEGHRANILNPDFTHIGVGYDPDGQHWTQMFIRK
ncbi:CAP domain-containing protein [Ornithinibacillus scapharcae]|uniref:CAP domain-containing protein n=1 Tax=Ornithinibacillus scapharcae TaxID=1147159 RepID=UPI000225BA46|nr:CAP domain-containing protein [Ornithinibacillus scapharcae]